MPLSLISDLSWVSTPSKNMMFIMIMCLHSPLHTVGKILHARHSRRLTVNTKTLIGWAGLSWSLSANQSASENPHYPAL